jgi:hypothetical protein
MTFDEHFIPERTVHLPKIYQIGIMIIFSFIWTGLGRSLNKFSINYDYAKDMNLVSKKFQITIKLAISTAVCNIDLQQQPVQ